LVLGTILTSLVAAPLALVAQTATQVVTFSVVSSSRVAIGNLTAAVQADAPSVDRKSRTSAMIAGTSYAVATNEKNQKITASLDASVPRSVSLAVALGAPPGAVSQGLRTLSTTATDVVTGISGSDGTTLPMRYQWNGTASTTALRNRVVTYTITAGL
jgi:K+-sensing histidine kinase KdpD